MQFIDIKQKQPVATETGDFDGKKCDDILVKTENGAYHVVSMYEVEEEGIPHLSFYDKHDFEIEGIVSWCYIIEN